MCIEVDFNFPHFPYLFICLFEIYELLKKIQRAYVLYIMFMY